MADNRDFRIRCDLCFPPEYEGVAKGLIRHLWNQIEKAININPDKENEEGGYCHLERCGHRIGQLCTLIENHNVENDEPYPITPLTLIVAPVDTPDVTSDRLSDGNFFNGGGRLGAGNWTTTSFAHPGIGCSMRFPLNLPNTVTIWKAQLIMVCHDHGLGQVVRTQLAVEDVVNAQRITSHADFQNRTRVSIPWENVEPQDTLRKAYVSIDFRTLIQHILEKPDWMAGNAVQLFWEDRNKLSDANAVRFIYGVQSGYEGYRPKLYIEYTV